MSTVDLNDLPANATLSVTREETAGERSVRLFKDVALFVMALIFVGLIMWISLHTLLDPHASPDDRKWSMSVLTGAAGGLIGYLIRK